MYVQELCCKTLELVKKTAKNKTQFPPCPPNPNLSVKKKNLNF